MKTVLSNHGGGMVIQKIATKTLSTPIATEGGTTTTYLTLDLKQIYPLTYDQITIDDIYINNFRGSANFTGARILSSGSRKIENGILTLCSQQTQVPYSGGGSATFTCDIYYIGKPIGDPVLTAISMMDDETEEPDLGQIES